MRRIISILLVTIMVFGALASLSGCKKIDSGTEAAKLLLANERLNGDDFNDIDLGLDDPAPSVDTTIVSISKNAPTKAILLSTLPMNEVSEKVTWSDFPEHSHSMVEFTQFMDTVEYRAESAANNISKMKNKVGITDKWVKTGSNEEQMLRVFEKEDVLIINDTGSNELSVYKRYTDENAKNVYEMYVFMIAGDQVRGKMKTVFIPGEKYEFMYYTNDGFKDYFIAENSRGYWMATRFTVGDSQSSTHFSSLVIKDGLGYGAHVVADNFSGELSTVWYDVFDPVNGIELMRVGVYENHADISVYCTAIESGLVSISSDKNVTDLDGDKKYQTSTLTELKTTAGTYYASNTNEVNKFCFSGGNVQYYYGEKIYYGSVQFTVNLEQGKSISNYIGGFESFASSIGLKLRCNMNNVSKAIYHAELLGNEFGSVFEWNGVYITNYAAAKAAEDILFANYDAAYGIYNEVKDFERTSEKQRLSKDADFADINVIVTGDNSYLSGAASITGIKLQTTDVALLEAGLEYVLKIGLSLCDENGNPISANTVALSGGTEEGVIFNGASIELSQSGSFKIPKNLSQGTYALVAYVATADGIRVSKMVSVSFVMIEEGELESSAMDIQTKSANGGNLHVTYTIKNVIRLEMESTKESYSHKEVRRAIMIEILAKGTPDESAVLEYEDGTTVSENASLGKGTYRMTAYFQTEDGAAQSYVYLTIK